MERRLRRRTALRLCAVFFAFALITAGLFKYTAPASSQRAGRVSTRGTSADIITSPLAPNATITVSSRYGDSAGTSPNGSQTFRLQKQVFTGSTNCSTGAGVTAFVGIVGNIAPHVFSIGAGDSVLLTAAASSQQNGGFMSWVSSTGGTFTTPGFDTKTICVSGASAHTFVVNFQPGITVLNAACTAPQTKFNIGDTVCTRVYINPADYNAGFQPLKVIFRDPTSATRGTSSNIAADLETKTFVIPVGPPERRGTWQALITDAMNTARGGGAGFIVSDPIAPAADVRVQKDAFVSQIHTSGTIQYELRVSNAGPDTATGVSVGDTTPPGTTFFSLTQLSGPTFACVPPAVGATGNIICTIASLPAGTGAFDPVNAGVFRVVLKADAGASGTITNSATANAGTTDLSPGNNTGNASGVTVANVCSFAAGCPADVTVAANTTCNGDPGAVVNFATPTTVGSCSGVAPSVPSGTCFKYGTNFVNFADGNGQALCQFRVIVTTTTAAGVSVSGRLLTPDGRGIRSAVVMLTGSDGSTRTVRAIHGGDFTFDDVPAGGTYTISVASRRFTFDPQVVNVKDNVSGLVFFAH